jgi:tetratricopeptide (TPR) repeat protein
MLGESYNLKGASKTALKYYDKWYDLFKKEGGGTRGSTVAFSRYGQLLIFSLQKEKGQQMIQKQIEYNEKFLESDHDDIGFIYDLVGIYSFLGQKESAYYWMERFDKENCWLKLGGLNSFSRVDPH